MRTYRISHANSHNFELVREACVHWGRDTDPYFKRTTSIGKLMDRLEGIFCIQGNSNWTYLIWCPLTTEAELWLLTRLPADSQIIEPYERGES